jgi:hypothetical protein
MLVAIAADIVAVRRSYMAGREIALAEVRRRWPECSDRALPELLDQILIMRIDEPPVFRSYGEVKKRSAR